MRQRLIEADLWDPSNNDDPTRSILGAWSVLARLGKPCRFAGRTPDGRFEYLVVDPGSGTPIASGHGVSMQEAMCRAALRARRQGG